MITYTRSIIAVGALAALSTLTTSAATRYGWQDSPSPGPPYDSWASAAHDIQAAVDAAQTGDGIARFDMGAHEFNPYRFEPTLHLGVDGF
jgi:hypothetical protein